MPANYRVKPGDCVLGIAADFGFADWNEIWDRPENKDLRARRSDPSLLAAGDVLFVPDPKPLVLTLATGKRHQVKVKRVLVAIRPQFLHMDATPIANAKYVIAAAKKPIEGQTDGDGWLDEKVPADARALKVTVNLTDDEEGPCYAWGLAVGHLDPIDTDSGVEQRLSNLGYWPPQEADPAALPFGLRAFQEDHDLDVTGEIDDATRDKLKEVHGGI